MTEPMNNALTTLLADALTALDGEPEYHIVGMGCGLEDRNITDRYEAMHYGWEAAMERAYAEHVNHAKDSVDAAIIETAELAAEVLALRKRVEAADAVEDQAVGRLEDALAENNTLRELLESARLAFVEIGETCWDKRDPNALKCACDNAALMATEAEEAIAAAVKDQA